MKKKVVCLFLLICSILSAYSIDEWPKIGTKWFYNHIENPMGGSGAIGYMLHEVTKDTIFAGKQCKVLRKTQFTSDNKSYFLGQDYIYYVNNKLYVYQKDSFYLLYDYSAKVGDVFKIKIFNPNQKIDTFMNVIVDSVTNITINDSILKKYYYRNEINPWRFSGVVIEKIGNLNYFFPFNELDCDAGICSEPLRCYQDNGFNYKQSFFDCDKLYTSIENSYNNQEEIGMYPNPSSDYVILKFKNQLINPILYVYNSSGQLMSIDKTIMNNKVQINIQEFADGLYYLKLVIDNKVYNKQFIKTK